MTRRIAPGVAICAALASAADGGWPLPRGFPRPPIPADNPLTAVKVELGRYLFYDKRLSGNGTASCATCHHQELAFTDGRPQAIGSTGQKHPRGAMTLVNVAYNAAFNWADPTVASLEQQALKPMFSTTPVELGTAKSTLLATIRDAEPYRSMFARAFAGQPDAYTIDNVAKALACFERTIISADSPYDRFHFGDDAAISEAAKRGEILFFLDDGGPSCFRCHGGFNFSDAVAAPAAERRPVQFHNTGLYNLPGPLAYPPGGLGLYEHTHRMEDVGRFKAPTLRNIALTAPYMHDGSIATLEEVVDHYAAGGRTIHDGPLAGIGRNTPGKDPLVHGFYLTPQNRTDLVAFLTSLTGDRLTHDPRWSDPWPN